jgi:sugar lactone lactonase YvrE
MSFEVALRMRNFDEMQARIARGEQISDAEKQALYFPLPADHDRVVAWLKAQGLEVTRTDANHLAVFGRGSVDAVARAFQVTFARVSVSGLGEFTSAVTAPSLPPEVSAPVLGIHGLQPHIRRHPLSLKLPVGRETTNSTQGYTPAQIAAAYSATALGVTGSNQTIAIYAFGFPATSDLTTFWSATGTSNSLGNVQMIDVAGGPAASPSLDILQEATLDVEWSSSLAPGATIRVYGANENDPANNDEILQQVYADVPSQPNMHVLSISIGGNESDVPHDYLIIEAQYMANLASAGVSVFVASGDNGSTPEANDVETTYPTSDPDVTGVGGTQLRIGPNNNGNVETGWADSGGGVSKVFSRPVWQAGTGVPVGTMRCVPDVSSAADPNYGGYFVFQGSSQGPIGGTSWSAPTWAAFCALLNEKRGTPLGLINTKIYTLIGDNTTGAGSFQDITSGSNGAYSAGVGYDLVTGIGTPNVGGLAADTFSSSPIAVSIAGETLSPFATITQPATLFVVGAGTPPISYKWQRMPSGSSTWSNLSDGGAYSGSAASLLTVSGSTLAMSGDQFQCIVSNGEGSVTSTPETLTVGKVGVTTLAGWPGSSGREDGTGRAARFAFPGGIKVVPNGNLYVSDAENDTVREVTPGGVVTTIAGVAGTTGSADGPASTATFNGVGGVAPDAFGNIYVADSGNYTIRKIASSGGSLTVSTLAGVAGTQGEVNGTGTQAQFYDPENIAVDSLGNVYVADGKGNTVRMVTPAGVVTTLAGSGRAGFADGTGLSAQFNDPTGIAVDVFGNVYVADNLNNAVRKVTQAGVVTTIAGQTTAAGSTDGVGSAATFNGPAGLGVDSFGNLYVADSNTNLVRKVDPTGSVTTVAGSPGVAENVDGVGSTARFDLPSDVAIDSTGIVYVADALNSTVRRLIPGSDAAPSFLQPSAQTAALGNPVILTMGILGTAPFTYQWNFNGSPISGATGPLYEIAAAQAANQGSYTVTVTNVDGSATSPAEALTVQVPTGAPSITVEPQGGLLTSGALVLSVTATGASSYQWFLNGSAIPGATSSAFNATSPGSYTVQVSNAVATASSSPAVVTYASRLINISTRADVQTGIGVTIAGFVIDGPAGSTKQLLIRGVGPALGGYGISDFVVQPSLEVYDANGNIIASNTAWGTYSNPSNLVTVESEVGAFQLPQGSNDSALIASLGPGNYTVELSGVNATSGVGLIEVYEVDTSEVPVLANISTRAAVGTGANVLIAGFVVGGSQSAQVLIRAVGPTLSNFGVSGTLAQPILTVYDVNSNQIATNTGWGNQTNASQINTVGGSVGAFALPTGSADSALILTLPPGNYTAEVSGVGGTTGVALVEVYQVEP